MNNIQDIILEFLNSLWRRRWYAAAVTWFVCLVGWGAVATMPDQYQSSSRIYVDTSSLLRPLLRGVAIQPNVENEVRLMRQTLLNRGNVETVMRMTDLDLAITSAKNKDQFIASLIRKTRIGGGRGSLFTISVTYDDPVIARDLVQAFTTVFVENNIGQNRSDTDVAREFIGEQTEFYRQQLEKIEKELAEFQRENRDVLPEAAGISTNNYFSAQNGLNEALAERNELKRQLSTIDQYIYVSSDAAASSSDAAQIASLEATIANLLSRYTENHPDVVVANRRLKRLKERVRVTRAASENSENAEPKVDVNGFRKSNPVYEALKVELVKSEGKIGVLRQRFRAVEKRWLDLKERADQAPLIGLQQKKLQREYGIVKGKYEQLLERRESLSIAENRSLKSDDVKFRIIDPPIVPTAPTGPNRPLFLYVVLFMGLASGGGFAGLLVLINQTFQNVRTLRSSFSIPIYGAVQNLNTRSKRRKAYMDFLGLGLAGGSLAAVFLLVAVLESRIGLPNVAVVKSAPQAIEDIKQLYHDGIANLKGRG